MNTVIRTEKGPGIGPPGAPANTAERYLDGVASLPPAPMLITELLTLFRQPDRDVDQVVQLISYEPSLTAQILRTCNSVHFAGEDPPGDIFEAVSRIGFYQVYCLVVSMFGARTKSMEGAGEGLDVDESWQHSVIVAVAAATVGDAAGVTKTVAFTAGLLHDVGKLVLASAERAAYARLVQKALNEKVPLSQMERTVLGVDHAEVGGELMRRWNLPADVVSAVSNHHNVQCAAPYEQLAAAVHVGDLIAHRFFAHDSTQIDGSSFSTAALEVLHLSPDNLPRLLEDIEAEMEKLKGLFEI
ncbi:MAG: HDOD domain-containing protein [Limisphaerales bacterium]